ncbi:MAG: ATP-dependent dethiobiotin synthetase BioD, partial [Alphaproteobacteria bacterium]
ISPWRFEAAIAPNMAARREGREIELAALADFCHAALEQGDVTLIEGVGGVSAPLSDTATVMDWMAALELPALVVLGSYLGAISHGLTAVAAIRAGAVPIAGIIVDESPESPVDLAETVDTFVRFLPDERILPVPRVPLGPRPWEKVPDLTALVKRR